MKGKYNFDVAILFLISMVFLTVVTACSPNISGSGILSREEVKGHDIATLRVTFFDDQDRLNSPKVILDSENADMEPHIEGFRNILSKSKGITADNDNKFSPVSDSSHYIEAIFKNDSKMDFYFSEDEHWLIWSNISGEDGEKIVEYHFLSPRESIEDWLRTIEPLASTDSQ